MVKKKATVKKKTEDEKPMEEEEPITEETTTTEDTELKKKILEEMMQEENRTPDEIDEAKKEVLEVDEFDIGNIEGIGAVRKQRLEENGIKTAMDILTTGSIPLAEITGMDTDMTAKIVKNAREYLEKAGTIRNSFMKASELKEYRDSKINSNRITSGCESINTLLGGGFEVQAVTEFYGVYGCGKTQICHTASVMAQLPKELGGLNGEVIWIDTENTFRPERIRDIVLERELVPIKKRKAGLVKGILKERAVPENELDVTKFLDRITVARATSASHQELILDQLSSSLKTEGDDKKENDPRPVLIVVDSLTTHYRSEYLGRGQLAPRQQELGKFLHKLARIAEVYNLAVIVTNQVLSNPDPFGNPIRPVGGNIVAHTSTYRIWLRKGSKSKRIAKMDDSPMHDQIEVVWESNVKGCDDPE